MRFTSHNSTRQRGFTLVELLVISPLVIIILAGIVGIVIGLTTESMRTTARSQLQNEVQAALDRMEEDVRTSLVIHPNSSFALKTNNFVTNKNPLATDRRLVKKDCSVATAGLLLEEALSYDLEYYVSGTNLMRKVSMHSCQSSPNAWQRSKTETVMANSGTNLQIDYITISSADPSAVRIKLTAKRLVAGDEISYTGVMYARSLNAQ